MTMQVNKTRAAHTTEVNGAGGSPPDASSLEGREGATLLVDPMAKLDASGDLGAMLAALVIRSGTADRNMERALRCSEEAAQDRAEAAEVAAMHDQATDILTGAVVSGAATMASGGCEVVGAAQAAEHRDRSAPRAIGGECEVAGAAKVEKDGWAGYATISKGVGTLGEGIYRAKATAHKADADEAEHQAGRAKRAADDAESRAKDAQDLLRKALDFYKDYLNAKDQARSAAVRRA